MYTIRIVSFWNENADAEKEKFEFLFNILLIENRRTQLCAQIKKKITNENDRLELERDS